ncbi:(2Fe-2S)-binding protein [Candidatus Bipolaricaulota bacterium]|nr:(2Fe-2S)-binding protein [Candidatus Bipolaricaulota bacterium]
MVNFVLNDRELEVEQGTTILDAALDAGVEIPHLCYHEELSAYGACRLCLVKKMENGASSLEPSCQTKVTEGMKVETHSEEVNEKRKIVFELLLAKAPESEKLKELASNYGVTKSRFDLDSYGKCILCGLCVRVCDEVVGMEAIGFSDRGVERTIKTPFGKISNSCIGCGACAYICPTDAIEVEEAT